MAVRNKVNIYGLWRSISFKKARLNELTAVH